MVRFPVPVFHILTVFSGDVVMGDYVPQAPPCTKITTGLFLVVDGYTSQHFPGEAYVSVLTSANGTK